MVTITKLRASREGLEGMSALLEKRQPNWISRYNTMKKISKLLVANRGEIASRVFATCRELGISTVAIYSKFDAKLQFVKDADHAVLIEGETLKRDLPIYLKKF